MSRRGRGWGWLACGWISLSSAFAIPSPVSGDIFATGPAEVARGMDRVLLEEWNPRDWLRTAGTGAVDFTKWLGIRQWCARLAMLPSATVESHRNLLAELIDNESFTTLLFETWQPADDFSSVLDVLARLRNHDPVAWKNHPALAIAIAVVHDSPPPGFWPHGQVPRDCLPGPAPSAEEVFSDWARASDDRRLLVDLRTLHPSQLKFLVDWFLPLDEAHWARKNIRLTRSRFENAFFQIRYQNERIARQEYDWPGGAPYTLGRIRESGGICVDQAHYAAQAGKALGLPTLFFTGQGPDGGHAWFGFLESPNRWNLEAGRYSRGDYPTGTALDPQTWQPINDHELTLLASATRRAPEFALSEKALAAASLLADGGEERRASELVDLALELCDANPAAWTARAHALAVSGANATVRRAHHANAARRFASSPDLRIPHQREIARLLREDGQIDEAGRLERLMEIQNRRKRMDLALASAADRMDGLLAARDWDAAVAEFLKQLRKNRASPAGGQLATTLGEPLFEALSGAGEAKRLSRCLAQLRRETSPSPNSPLDLFLQRWENERSSPAAPEPNPSPK